MNLSGLFTYGNKNTKSNRTEAVKASTAASSAASHKSQQIVKNLVPGQTIQGEVVSKNGNEVQIMVDKDVVITARLERELNISVGQNMTFEIKANSGSQIALRPLFENLAQDANILKALDAANLPLTDDFMKMVSTMMKQGMPIDKNSLQDMSRVVMANSTVDPEIIVTLRNLQIPVTPENIEQLKNYQSYEHQLLHNVTDFLTELPEVFHSMTNSGQSGAAVDFYMQILQLFSGEINTGSQEDTILNEAGKEQPIIMESNPENVANVNKAEAETVITKTIMDMVEIHPEVIENETDMIEMNQSLKNPTPQESGLIDNILSGNEKSVLLPMLRELGFSQEQLLQIARGEISGKQLLQDISNLLSQSGETISHESIVHLFGSKEFTNLLNHEILQQWLIKPGQVAQKNSIETFYERLREQTTRLTEALSQVAKDTPLAKNVTVMQNNIDFMNQINHIFNYIQLPLKMAGGNAHGDLFVYTNRRNTSKEDGSVSALLHLDMEYLGAMDIHILMKDKNVNTKFYLQDESMIDFISENIHMLNDRLAKKGYSMNAEMLVSEKQNTNVIDTMKNQAKKENLLSQYSFDVRA